MNTGRFIRMLRPSSIGHFVVLLWPLSCSHPAKRVRGVFVGCLIGLLFLFSAGAVVAAPCWTVTGYWPDHPTRGFENDANTYGLFRNAYAAFKSVEQVAVQSATDYLSPIVDLMFPYYVGCRITPDPLSQDLVVSSTDPGRLDFPGFVLFWNATWANDAGFCPPVFYLGFISAEAVNTPLPKNLVTLAQFSEGFIDRVNATCAATQQQYTIKLSNDANPPTSGDLAEVEPGKVTTTLRATVYDNNNQPVPNINVKLEVTVEANSGGHQHNVDRPKGLLSNGISAGIVIEGNTGSGGMPFTFLARPPAGDHKIIATCVGRDCPQEGPDKVWVGIRGLVPFTQPGSYVLVGFTPSHPAKSHNLKPTVSGLVRALANVYRSRFRQDPVLHLNDASLERGGLFDSSAHEGKPWQPPHLTHRVGTDIDIRWNPTKHPTTSIPDRNVDKFKKQVSDVGGKAVPAYVGTDNQHFHVEFGG